MELKREATSYDEIVLSDDDQKYIRQNWAFDHDGQDGQAMSIQFGIGNLVHSARMHNWGTDAPVTPVTAEHGTNGSECWCHPRVETVEGQPV